MSSHPKNCRVSYRENNTRNEIILNENNVNLAKVKISKTLNIHRGYIVLKYEDRILDDKYNLIDHVTRDNGTIMMYIGVVVFDIPNSNEDRGKCHTLTMEYDARVKDLQLEYRSKISDVRVEFKNGNICNADEYLRDYLRNHPSIFIAMSVITVNVIGEYGDHCSMDAYDTDTVGSIRMSLIERRFLRDNKAPFMHGNELYKDGDQLSKYQKCDPLTIFVSFLIYVEYEDIYLSTYCVNYCTTILRLKELLSKYYVFKLNMISLKLGSKYLDDRDTVGICGLEDGDRLSMVFNVRIIISIASTNDVTEYFLGEGQFVRELKKEVSVKSGINDDRMILSLDNKELSDDTMLESLHLNDDSILYMTETDGNNDACKKDCLNSDSELKIRILKRIQGSTNNDSMEYIVKNGQTIRELKDKVSIACGISADRMILSLENAELKDDVVMDSLSFSNESILKMTEIDRESYKNVLETTNSETMLSLKVMNKLQGSSNCDNPRIIHVDKNGSIEYLRDYICRELYIGMCSVDIHYLDRILRHGTIDNYGIKDGSCLILRKTKKERNLNEQFILYLKQDSQSPQPVLIEENYTIGNLKVSLRSQYNVSVECIKIIYSGQELNDDDVIMDLEIKNGETLNLEINKEQKYDQLPIEITVKRQLLDDTEENSRQIFVSSGDKIETLQQNINDAFSLSSNEYVISFNDEILKKENLLSTYNIVDKDTVDISHSVLIRYMLGGFDCSAKIQRYPLKPGDKVEDLKSKIKKKTNIEERFIQLSYNGNALEDKELLQKIGIVNESYLMMIATLAGGELTVRSF